MALLVAYALPGANLQRLRLGGNLRLNAPALLNERGLLFSGADMTLRAGDITNLYGDVYSLGRLDIARDDAANGNPSGFVPPYRIAGNVIMFEMSGSSNTTYVLHAVMFS